MDEELEELQPPTYKPFGFDSDDVSLVIFSFLYALTIDLGR